MKLGISCYFSAPFIFQTSHRRELQHNAGRLTSRLPLRPGPLPASTGLFLRRKRSLNARAAWLCTARVTRSFSGIGGHVSLQPGHLRPSDLVHLGAHMNFWPGDPPDFCLTFKSVDVTTIQLRVNWSLRFFWGAVCSFNLPTFYFHFKEVLLYEKSSNRSRKMHRVKKAMHGFQKTFCTQTYIPFSYRLLEVPVC